MPTRLFPPCLLMVMCILAAAGDATEKHSPTLLIHDEVDEWRVFCGRLCGSSIVIEDRTRRLYRDLPGCFSDEDLEQHCVRSTAGWWCFGNAFSCFAKLDGVPHFHIRTGWNMRVLYNLETLELVPLPDDCRELNAAERQAVYDALYRVAFVWKGFRPPHVSEDVDVGGAVLTAGRLKLRNCTPFLRRIEQRNWHNEYRSDSGLPTLNGLQGVLGWSLRQLGEQPRVLRSPKPSQDVRHAVWRYDRSWSPEREVHLYEVARGQMPRGVAATLGIPDTVFHKGRNSEGVWLYEFAQPVPHRFFLEFTEGSATRCWFESTPPNQYLGPLADLLQLNETPVAKTSGEVEVAPQRAGGERGGLLLMALSAIFVGAIGYLGWWASRR